MNATQFLFWFLGALSIETNRPPVLNQLYADVDKLLESDVSHENIVYFIQGVFECNFKNVDVEHYIITEIKNHLALVFNKVTPIVERNWNYPNVGHNPAVC